MMLNIIKGEDILARAGIAAQAAFEADSQGERRERDDRVKAAIKLATSTRRKGTDGQSRITSPLAEKAILDFAHAVLPLLCDNGKYAKVADSAKIQVAEYDKDALVPGPDGTPEIDPKTGGLLKKEAANQAQIDAMADKVNDSLSSEGFELFCERTVFGAATWGFSGIKSGAGAPVFVAGEDLFWEAGQIFEKATRILLKYACSVSVSSGG
ncbi:hypothetical protein FACS1894186_4770 [Alphaproteobacteria bacterium]|nr:hypothetical protein FACS1894186_4770 [Alphaproteobacteria bacterium]